MQLVDLTLATPEENLALDEALLERADDSPQPREYLRLWQSPQPVVVVGRSSQRAAEVNLEFCRRRGIRFLRRVSGGAAIVAGPGCLMYAVVLSHDLRPETVAVDAVHRLVLSIHVSALRNRLRDVNRRGTSDMALGDLKFSGSSMRAKRRACLHHGTLLFDFDLSLIESCLAMPPRQPEYRQGRAHHEFVTNLPLGVDILRAALIQAWNAEHIESELPHARTQQLVAERYSCSEWNEQR
jgi:lipoate---protein ligase